MFKTNLLCTSKIGGHCLRMPPMATGQEGFKSVSSKQFIFYCRW